MPQGQSGLRYGSPPPRYEKTAATAETVESFDDFFRQHAKPLARLAEHLGASAADAQDAASETLVETCRRWDKIDNPVAYAKTALAHWVIKIQQNTGRNGVPVDTDDIGTSPRADYADLTGVVGRQLIESVLCRLNPAQREVVEGRLWGETYRELSRQTGRSEEALRQSLAAARRKLAEDYVVSQLLGRQLSDSWTKVREEAP